MKGLERITQRIQTDAQGQIEALTAAGRRQFSLKMADFLW